MKTSVFALAVVYAFLPSLLRAENILPVPISPDVGDKIHVSCSGDLNGSGDLVVQKHRVGRNGAAIEGGQRSVDVKGALHLTGNNFDQLIEVNGNFGDYSWDFTNPATHQYDTPEGTVWELDVRKSHPVGPLQWANNGHDSWQYQPSEMDYYLWLKRGTDSELEAPRNPRMKFNCDFQVEQAKPDAYCVQLDLNGTPVHPAKTVTVSVGQFPPQSGTVSKEGAADAIYKTEVAKTFKLNESGNKVLYEGNYFLLSIDLNSSPNPSALQQLPSSRHDWHLANFQSGHTDLGIADIQLACSTDDLFHPE